MTWWRAARPWLAALLFAGIGWVLVRQWTALATALQGVTVQWRWVAASTAVVLATYAVLIQGWRMLLAGWGGTLPFWTAVRIWTIANLGRWIPGKVWSVGALGVLAREAGVNGIAAAGAAILGTALNIGAGCAVAVLLGARALEALNPAWGMLARAGLLLFLLVVAALPWLLPAAMGRLAAGRGVPLGAQQLTPATIWQVTAIHVASWLGYGVAFALFSRGVTPGVSGNPGQFIAVFSASYLAGYLVLFAPGGVGVREGALTALLVSMGSATTGDAVLLGVLSRGWLTVLEILPGMLSLAMLPRASRSALRQSG